MAATIDFVVPLAATAQITSRPYDQFRPTPTSWISQAYVPPAKASATIWAAQKAADVLSEAHVIDTFSSFVTHGKNTVEVVKYVLP